jgi:hypothetical protein
LKDWFEWADESKSLTAGARLVFHLHSEVTYKDKANYRSIAYVEFEREESQGNPVVAYLQRHGLEKSAPIPLATEYNITSDSNISLYYEPSTNEPYSRVSRDFNPIRTNPYCAAYASFPGSNTPLCAMATLSLVLPLSTSAGKKT